MKRIQSHNGHRIILDMSDFEAQDVIEDLDKVEEIIGTVPFWNLTRLKMIRDMLSRCK